MTSHSYAKLSWLPAPPADFTARCRQLAQDPGGGENARRLANHDLDEAQLHRLGKVLERLPAAAREPLAPFRLGIVSNATTHLLVPALVATAARYGLGLECVEADYGQVMQSALDPDSVVNQARCDAVLLAVDHRGLGLLEEVGDGPSARASVESAVSLLQTVRDGLRKHGAASCILQTVPRPVESLFGNFDFVLEGTRRQQIDELNRAIAASVSGSADLLLDVAHLAESVGLSNWHDPTLWNLAKLPFASELVPLYADHVCRLLAALRGKSRKCLVLDLDNTLWGGIVGDDGVDGIVVGQGNPTGEAHLSLQRAALSLRQRGIVLAVSSKNQDDTARRPFREHPEMLLKEEHFAVFQANWNDKATNLAAIAQELSLGLDSLVFVDDNPVERNLVRQLLPQVAVPELPEDPALYARTLLAAGYFEAVAFSEEDRKRAAMYQDNARRVALQKQAGDVDEYLRSLEMQVSFAPFDEAGRARITQLINKSNQFNLTTRRYTEREVAEAERDPNALTLQIRLSDRLGDNGMVSVVICRVCAPGVWDIDTWLMSCRVLGRKLERAVLAELVMHAKNAGIARIRGRYLPTEKNAMVADHYEKLGFKLQSRKPSGESSWEFCPDSALLDTALPLAIRRVAPAKRARLEQPLQVESELVT